MHHLKLAALLTTVLAVGFLAGGLSRSSQLHISEPTSTPGESPRSTALASQRQEAGDDTSRRAASSGQDSGLEEGSVQSSAAHLASEEDATIQLFRDASPAVVFITTLTVRRDFYSLDLTQIPSGTGSGFVWDREGNIVTNYHVIQGADRAQITLADQSSWSASLVGASPERDLAVLRIDAPRDALHPLPIGSSRRLQVGQKAFAIGNPFGLDHTLTTGIVSALGREIESAARIPIRDVIQTDAAINPGNSGGPLLDRNGRLIGVNTSIVSPSGAYAGIGFAIPVDTVAWVVPELITNGRIAQPVLGLRLASTQLNERLGVEGALILAVEPGGPAARAGLQPTRRDRYGRLYPGDILISLDDKEIRDDNDLYLALERRSPGERLVAVVQRDGATREVILTLAASR